jgi:hypothetical protein
VRAFEGYEGYWGYYWAISSMGEERWACIHTRLSINQCRGRDSGMYPCMYSCACKLRCMYAYMWAGSSRSLSGGRSAKPSGLPARPRRAVFARRPSARRPRRRPRQSERSKSAWPVLPRRKPKRSANARPRRLSGCACWRSRKSGIAWLARPGNKPSSSVSDWSRSVRRG